MRKPQVFGRVVFCVLAGMLAFLVAPSGAENCDCNYSRDCSANEYCNFQAKCTRHCELQIDEWDPDWGTPPVSSPDCDTWIGPCHDSQPQPPNGDDGDGENCEPPTAPNPGGGGSIPFMVRDGMCTKRPAPKSADQAMGQVSSQTSQLVSIANAGGGSVVLTGDPYINDVMLNLAQLALGQYDMDVWPGGGAPPLMADVRGTCGAEALQVLGDALVDEITAVAASLHQGGNPTGPLAARDTLDRLSIECQTWVERRPQDCQYPHPPEHYHEFPFADGLTCIAEELAAAARSMNLEGAVVAQP